MSRRKALAVLTAWRPYAVAIALVALVVLAPPVKAPPVAAGAASQQPGQALGAGPGVAGAPGTAASLGHVRGAGALGGSSAVGAGQPVTSPGASRTGGGTAPGVVTQGTSVLDAGIGTPAALNAPDCDRTTGRIRISFTYAPQCVRPWPAGADNGGATSQGVTAKSIRIVVYLADQSSSNAQAQAAGFAGVSALTPRDENAYRDDTTMLEHLYRTWGRSIDLRFVVQSGTDETAQRADAEQVASLKPFIVMADPGAAGSVFEAETAKRHIITFGYHADPVLGREQAPYRYGLNPDPYNNMAAVAEFVGKTEAGHAAKWAGDPTLQTQTRKFGIVLPNTIDKSFLLQQLAHYGVSIDPNAIYQYRFDNASSLGADPTTAQEEAPIAVAKMVNAHVNNVIAFTDLIMTAAMTKQATSQKYLPEWTITGFNFQDIDFFARTYDQTQWQHAFGIGSIFPYVVNAKTAPEHLFDWYWGVSHPHNSPGATTDMSIIFSGIHLAGPDLTPQTYQQALFSYAPSGGKACGCVLSAETSYGNHGVFPWVDYNNFDDWDLVWWDPKTSGTGNGLEANGEGKHYFLYGAARYTLGHFPRGELPEFDKSQSIYQYVDPPKADQPPNYPCRGCPSSSG